MRNPIVFIIGHVGSGKTHFVKCLAQAGHRIQHLYPNFTQKPSSVLVPSLADWENHEIVAIDEFNYWEKESFVPAFKQMAQDALRHAVPLEQDRSSKRLLLLVQSSEQIARFEGCLEGATFIKFPDTNIVAAAKHFVTWLM